MLVHVPYVHTHTRTHTTHTYAQGKESVGHIHDVVAANDRSARLQRIEGSKGGNGNPTEGR